MRIAITEGHLGARKAKRLAASRHEFHLIDKLFKLGAIGAGIHVQGAAHASGNSLGEFQPRIAAVRCIPSQLSD